ncbi:MAG: DNA mismatch repair endonuclease MutL [Pseudomonadota bacterium]
MTRIEILSDEVASKIAAGEVVERPASVLKELIENSIDAGATRIDVEWDAGGMTRLSVRDDGAGIDRLDMPRTIIRHATSKIKTADDLFTIKTMGFRGEALASIASVSKFTILTQPPNGEGSKLQVLSDYDLLSPKISPWSGPVGTTVIMEDLFYNVPARLNFLRKSTSESAACLELIQNIALCNPAVSFSAMSNGKYVLQAEKIALSDTESTLRARAKQIIEDVDQLLFIKDETSFGQVTGLISPPGLDRSTARNIYTFVNHRLVKDKILRFALQRGYHGHLLKGRQPVAIIQVVMDPSLVDVNAHPAKTEIRFQYPEDVQSLISLAIRKAIRDADWAAPQYSESSPSTVPPPAVTAAGTENEAHADFQASSYRAPLGRFVGEDFGNDIPSSKSRDFSSPISHQSFSKDFDIATTSQATPWRKTTETKVSLKSYDGSSYANQASSQTYVDRRDTSPSPLEASSSPKATTWKPGRELFEKDKKAGAIPWADLTYIGTFAKCYLIFEYQKKLLLADQHAFHERILFEKLSHDPKLLKTVQPLIIPEVYTLSPEEAASLEQNLSKWKDLGFDLKIWTNGTVELNALPSILVNANKEALLAELSEKSWSHHDSMSSDISSEVLETIACHTAVRSGEDLTENGIRDLLSQASEVDFYHNCPHGRRVFRWFDEKDVGSWFDR